LLEEAEFTARRDAEQMGKALVDLRDALTKIEAIREESWSGGNFDVELTRALTTLENARMEWNSARLKFAVLNGQVREESNEAEAQGPASIASLVSLPFWRLCRIGLALTCPVPIVGLSILATLLILFVRR
jgi:hypothetical protein